MQTCEKAWPPGQIQERGGTRPHEKVKTNEKENQVCFTASSNKHSPPKIYPSSENDLTHSNLIGSCRQCSKLQI